MDRGTRPRGLRGGVDGSEADEGGVLAAGCTPALGLEQGMSPPWLPVGLKKGAGQELHVFSSGKCTSWRPL